MIEEEVQELTAVYHFGAAVTFAVVASGLVSLPGANTDLGIGAGAVFAAAWPISVPTCALMMMAKARAGDE
jgi:hypothetical protein